MMQFNPAIALLMALLYSLCVSFSIFEWFYLAPIVFILYIQRTAIAKILQKLLFLNLFIFVLFLVLLIESSWQEALNVYIRANAIILFNIALFYSSKGYDLVRGMNLLKAPDALVASTYFTLKMIESLSCDFKQLKNTLRTRGFKAKTSLFTYETFGNVVGLLFVKAIRKSNALKQTFMARGFSGSIYLNDHFEIKRLDYILMGTVLAMIVMKGVI